MPCKIYIRADPDAIYSNEPADVVAERIEQAGGRFVAVELTPQGHGDVPRTAYVAPGDVSAILPMDPRELAHELDNPPDWHPSA